MPANSVVSGVATNATSATFQTGDTINGSTNTTLNILQTETAANSVTATLNNVANVNVRALGSNTTTYTAATWTGVNNVTVTQGVANTTTAITNASAATTFGMSGSAISNLNVSFTAGATGRTFLVAVNNAGTLNNAGTIDYNGANSDINAISLSTSGTNNVVLNGTTSVRTVTITGNGANTIDLSGASALSATAAVTINAANATGANTINLGTNLATSGVTVNGSTATGVTTTLGLTISNGLVTLPTLNNVQALQLNAGSNGILIAGTPNTSVTALTILDVTTGANSNAYNLIGFSGINSVTFGTTGGGNNQAGGLTLTGSGALVQNFALQTTATLSSANSLVLGAQNLTGYTSLAINTANGLGATGSFTVGAAGGGVDIQGNALQTLTVTSASTGLVQLNEVDSTNASSRGTLTSINLSGVAGSSALSIGENSLAAASSIQGSVGATTIDFGSGTQTGATQIAVTLQNGNNAYNGGAVNVAHVITAGSGNNSISTGTAADVITVGSGINTISAGTGTNVINLAASRTTSSNGSDLVFVSPATDSIRNFVVSLDDLLYDVSEYDAVAANALLTTGSGSATSANTSAGATVSFQTVSALGAFTTTADNEVIVFSLAAINSASALQTSLRTSGGTGTLMTFSDTNDTGSFLAAYDDGVNSYLALITVDTAKTTAAATVTNIATLVGVADVTTITTGDFAFI